MKLKHAMAGHRHLMLSEVLNAEKTNGGCSAETEGGRTHGHHRGSIPPLSLQRTNLFRDLTKSLGLGPWCRL